jgi:endonuclease YncB( thermonuclease family)
MNSTSQKVTVNIFGLDIVCTLTECREGYTFKTPKGFGGRHYYQFCNDLDIAFTEQYPELEFEMRKRRRGEWPESYVEQYALIQKAMFS